MIVGCSLMPHVAVLLTAYGTYVPSFALIMCTRCTPKVGRKFCTQVSGHFSHPFNGFAPPREVSMYTYTCSTVGSKVGEKLWNVWWALSRPSTLSGSQASQDPSTFSAVHHFLVDIRYNNSWRRTIIYFFDISTRPGWDPLSTISICQTSFIKLMTWRSIENFNETTRST